jgi:hypothetical protein
VQKTNTSHSLELFRASKLCTATCGSNVVSLNVSSSLM